MTAGFDDELAERGHEATPSMAPTPPPSCSIQGMALPAALVLAMHERRWRCPTSALLRRVFRESPVTPLFHDLSAMRLANRQWRSETDPAYFGHRDEQRPPGDIDCRRSILLGVLGPEMPFALDYREHVEHPPVLYLHSGGDRWITIATDVEDLLVRLQLHRASSRARAR